MKVLVLGKATAASEAGEFATPDEFVAMEQYSEQLAQSGIVLAVVGSSRAARASGSPSTRRAPPG